MKLLLDEQISGSVAARLRGLGHDVVALAADPDFLGIDDIDVFGLAQRDGRAVVTYDCRDFERIIRRYATEKRSHHGLVLVHSNQIPSGDLARLTRALAALLDGPELGPSFTIWLKERPRMWGDDA